MFELICDQPPPPLREELAIEERAESEYEKEEWRMELDCMNKASIQETSKKSHEAIFMQCFLHGRAELREKYQIPEPKGEPCKNCHPNHE